MGCQTPAGALEPQGLVERLSSFLAKHRGTFASVSLRKLGYAVSKPSFRTELHVYLFQMGYVVDELGRLWRLSCIRTVMGGGRNARIIYGFERVDGDSE